MIAMPSSASSLPSNAPSVGVVSSATGPAGARIDVLKARWEFSVDVDRLHMELRHESTRPVAMSAAAQTSLSPTATGPSASPSAKPTTTMRRVVSVTDLRNVDAGSARDTHEPEQQAARQLVAQQSSSAGPADARVVPRVGVMAYCHTFDELKQSFSHLLDEFPDTKTDARPPTAGGELEPVHVLYVSFVWGQRLPSDDQLSELFSSFLRGFRETLLRSGVRRVTFVVPHGDNYPFYFTYRHHLDYREDRITRHVEPSLSLFLELNRLSNFALELVPTTNRMVHLFEGRPLSPLRGGSGASVGASIGESDGRRLFARVIVRQVDSHQFADELAGDSKVDEASASGGPNEVLVSAVGAKGRRLSTTDEVERELDLDAHPETEVAFVEALAAIETAMGGDRTRHLSNTILINVLVEAQLSVDYISRVIRMLARRYSEKIQLLNIASVEFLLRIKRTSLPPHRLASDDDAEPDRGKPSDAASAVTSAEAATVRFVCSNPTGAMLLIHVYEQRRDQRTGEVRLHALDADAGAPLDGLNIETPVPVSQPFEKQRLLARAAGTTWVYDLLTLLEKAARQLWRRAGKDRLGAGSRVLEATELVLSAPSKADEGEGGENGADAKETMQDATEGVSGRRTFDGTLPQVLRGRQRLVEVQRPAGQNTIGMVAWSVKLRLPFDDAAREVILIANDVTFQAGTFGTQEDVLFKLASSRARELGIARLYVAANSGARIGLADEIKGKFRVAWLGDDPLRGVEYLYLSDADYQANPRSAVCERRQVGEEVRWVIRDIIGAKGDLGVENLQGSGMIAGETSSAFDEIFTLSYVTGRTVGIGSYLVRLGQRCIQRKGSPIILTGYQALNKLLGRAVYSSNTQLGGVEIMFTNGVSHLVVEDDLEGVLAMLRWLSYVPSHRGLTMRAACSDPVERAVGWRPSKEGYDASLLMEGWVDPATGEWQSGFFDRGSFLEILGGWARTVVVGRARLGGVAMGVIAVGTQAVEQTYPADPAAPESKENSVLRAAQVWFPDSAYKTAQAVRDMAAEDLPIMIFANWRGFSGGMQDMLDEVLKFGSYIVDHLRSYRKPIFIYLPPFATLRGGAWVVVDPTINRPFMEMYADEQSRGGVLEPEGTVDVKFRHADVCAMAHRVDPVLCNLDRELSALDARSPEADALRKRVREREALVLPICHQVATTFADLHDTPGRMLAKGVIRACVRWEDSRHFFYLRLVRRLAECEVVGRISAALSEVMATEAPSQSRGSVPRGSAATDFESQWDRALSALRSWLASDVGAQRVDEVWNSDSAMTEWLASRKSLLDAQVRNLQERGIAERLRATAQRDPAAFAQLVTQSLSGLGAPAIESLRAALSGFGAFRSQSQ
jgi:acetyl-CoA carboxylase carboxyltransferase component